MANNLKNMTPFDKACNSLKVLLSSKVLKKNEIALSSDNQGLFYVDFGSNVTPELQKSAISWLEQQGYTLQGTKPTVTKTIKKRWFV